MADALTHARLALCSVSDRVATVAPFAGLARAGLSWKNGDVTYFGSRVDNSCVLQSVDV